MTQEEKAKAYDDLLVKLQKAKVDNDVCDERYCCVIDSIVPELKESEDEKIRKEIARFVQMEVEDEIVGNKWLAWLEKQGEKGTNGNEREIPNSVWNEEDEKMFRGIITICDIWSTKTSFYPKQNDDIVNLKKWFKSIKDRVQPQTTWKPSDEQMKALNIAISCGIQLGTWEEDALKSLKEQLFKLKKLKG